MKDICVVTDFDGTITVKDTLYNFFEDYAAEEWTKVEQYWTDGKISSKECLLQEFALVQNLSKKLVKTFLEKVEIDKYFKDFYDFVNSQNIDVYIVSDGVDYFIEAILKKFGVENIKVVSNHGEFKDNVFYLTFPNDNPHCLKDSGTCKCAVVNELKNSYKKVIYIGDGVSDYCVADKADIIFAKKRLLEYCMKTSIPHIPYLNFKDVLNSKIFSQK